MPIRGSGPRAPKFHPKNSHSKPIHTALKTKPRAINYNALAHSPSPSKSVPGVHRLKESLQMQTAIPGSRCVVSFLKEDLPIIPSAASPSIEPIRTTSNHLRLGVTTSFPTPMTLFSCNRTQCHSYRPTASTPSVCFFSTDDSRSLVGVTQSQGCHPVRLPLTPTPNH